LFNRGGGIDPPGAQDNTGSQIITVARKQTYNVFSLMEPWAMEKAWTARRSTARFDACAQERRRNGLSAGRGFI